MIDINLQINKLLEYGLERGLIKERDRTYVTNRLLCKLGILEFTHAEVKQKVRHVSEILEPICSYGVENNLCGDTQTEKDIFDTEIMDCLMPMPHEVETEFYRLYSGSPKEATNYYYELSKNSNYIRSDRIEKDKMWKSPTKYGDIVITINMSKPEKDPKEIAAAKNAVQSGYPKCALCRENEGYKGSMSQAARANHRLIPFSLANEDWFLQYSPYVYYNEHCIVLSGKHAPMQINKASMGKLLEFEEKFPHYFIGSNADLPIVGGSILSHEHFQGGNFEFPMAKADIRKRVNFKGFEDIETGIVDWPMSVIRLSGKDRGRVLELADKILTFWREYSDESVQILAYTEDTPHNTITPIARRRGENYEMDLVLRNNRTTKEHPLGIFHPHSEYHHIKKENIGLIEVMGFAVLPPRLVGEMESMEKALLNPDMAQELLSLPKMEKHSSWYAELKKLSINEKTVQRVIEDSIGEIFMKILGNAGVYKDTEEGNAAIIRFCECLN